MTTSTKSIRGLPMSDESSEVDPYSGLTEQCWNCYGYGCIENKGGNLGRCPSQIHRNMGWKCYVCQKCQGLGHHAAPAKVYINPNPSAKNARRRILHAEERAAKRKETMRKSLGFKMKTAPAPHGDGASGSQGAGD